MFMLGKLSSKLVSNSALKLLSFDGSMIGQA
jgi:hypothetical protein